MKLIQNTRRAWLRLRYQMAAADLAWMENRLHACLAEQRERVDEIGRRLDKDEAQHGAEAVRQKVERKAKREGAWL